MSRQFGRTPSGQFHGHRLRIGLSSQSANRRQKNVRNQSFPFEIIEFGTCFRYASSESGHVFEMSYKDVCLLRVVPASPLPHPSIPSVATSHVDSAHSVRCIAASEVFLAVGSADGLLRLWKTDFTGPFLETGINEFLSLILGLTAIPLFYLELEGGVLSVCVSSDGLKVAVSSDKVTIIYAL